MNLLRARLAAAEARMKSVRPGIVSVIIVNGPERLRDSVGISAPHHFCYNREPDEAMDAFRRRAASEAELAGECTIIFNENQADFGARVDEARERAYPGREAAIVNETHRAFSLPGVTPLDHDPARHWRINGLESGSL